MAPEKSTLLVREFPRTLRQQIHARAALEGRMLHEVFAEIVEKGLAAAEAEQQKKRRQP